MQLRKIWPEKMFDGYRFLKEHVLIITEQGVVEEVIPLEKAGDDVEQLEGLLVPGFVNCHCHLELSHMKGKVAEHTGLVDFVFKIVTERAASEETILEAIAKAEEEMKKAGIVAVGDICNNASTIPQKQKGNLKYYNFIEASGWLPAVSETRFERAKALQEEFNVQSEILNASKNYGLQNSIVPHAPYSVSEDLWQLIQPYFQKKVTSIHNQETKFEDEFFLKGTGDFKRMYDLMKIDNAHHVPTSKSSLQSSFEKLTPAEKIILVHNSFTKQEDVDFVNKAMERQTSNFKSETFFCLCVNANLYIENQLPPIELFRKNNCSIVLGTDSLASNWSLSIPDEIKTIRRHFPQIPLEEILGWATINGARALGMDGYLGSFDRGKQPGVVVMSEKEMEVTSILF